MEVDCESPVQENGSEDVEMVAVWDRNIDPLVLEEKFRGRMSEFEGLPHSDGDDWIFENLTPWNRVLSKIGYALDEYEPGKARLRPMNTFLHVSGDEEYIEMGFYLFYRLLKYHTCVKSLEIGDHLSFIQYASLINAALSACSSLESLKVVGVPEDPKNGGPLVRGIASVTTLEHLTLKGLVLSSNSEKMLVEMLKSARHLRSLRLDNVELTAGNAALLRNAASGLQNLTELAVTKKGLNEQLAVAISSLLTTTGTITKLDLSDHWDADDGILKIICGALASNRTLRVVTMNETRIKNVVYVYLADALKQNTSIQEIYLDTDSLEDDGMKAVGDMIKSNNTLQVLKWQLSFTDISDVGARALAEGIAANTKLLQLSLQCVYVGFEGTKLILDALSRNTTLRELSFRNCFEFEKQECETLAAYIKERGLFGRIQMNQSPEEIYAQASIIPTSEKIRKVVVPWLEHSAGEEIKALFEAMCKSASVAELEVEIDELPQVAVPALATLLRTTKSLKKVDIPVAVRESSTFDDVMEALAINESITELKLHCEMLNSHAEEKLGSMLKRNRNIHTLIINDASTEFSVSRSPPHMVLADYLESNWTLLSLTNSYAWVPQDGLFRIEEVLRRNRRLLHRARAFALSPAVEEKLARDFQVVAHADSLVESIANVTGKTSNEAREIVAEALNFVNRNFSNV
ncbi:NLR family CARD domain-containing protein 3-like [Ornithodoros turicata]|uniref:NLR family CARD domain-containing protein 3-like n=1 Tax=Ornithodoros turicata TaxID=34597 RepID=UPI003139CC04